MSAPMNIITFLPDSLPSDNKKFLRELNPVPYPEYLYLSKPAFLVNLTAPKKKKKNFVT